MLTKDTRRALQAELATLNATARQLENDFNKQISEIEIAKASILQVLNLSDVKQVTSPAPDKGEPRISKKLITMDNREEVRNLVFSFLTGNEASAKSVSQMLREKGFPLSQKSVSCLLYRLKNRGEIEKSENSTPHNALYTTKGV